MSCKAVPAAGPSNDPAERAEREDAGIINKISQYLARTTQILTVRLKNYCKIEKIAEYFY